jgi:hypothetical protein
VQLAITEARSDTARCSSRAPRRAQTLQGAAREHRGALRHCKVQLASTEARSDAARCSSRAPRCARAAQGAAPQRQQLLTNSSLQPECSTPAVQVLLSSTQASAEMSQLSPGPRPCYPQAGPFPLCAAVERCHRAPSAAQQRSDSLSLACKRRPTLLQNGSTYAALLLAVQGWRNCQAWPVCAALKYVQGSGSKLGGAGPSRA